MLISGSQIQSCKWADQVLPPARLIGERGWLKPSPSEDAVARCYEPLNAPGACLKLMMVGYQRASAYGILMLPLQAGRDERMAQLHWGHSAPVRGALKNCMDSLMKSVRATPDFLHLTIIDSLRNFFLPQICHWNTSKKKKKNLLVAQHSNKCVKHTEKYPWKLRPAGKVIIPVNFHHRQITQSANWERSPCCSSLEIAWENDRPEAYWELLEQFNLV